MARQLNIRSDEAYAIAKRISDQLQKPVADVVVAALRAYGSTLPKQDDMTPTQWADYQSLRALAREAAKHKCPGATSNHDDMYDEFGLPI